MCIPKFCGAVGLFKINNHQTTRDTYANGTRAREPVALYMSDSVDPTHDLLSRLGPRGPVWSREVKGRLGGTGELVCVSLSTSLVRRKLI